MKPTAIASVIAIGAALAASAADSLTFQGNASAPVVCETTPSSGLAKVYVIENTPGVTASYTAANSGAAVEWYRFSNLGGGFAEPVAARRNGAVTSVDLGVDDMGYIIDEGTTRTCFWIVNYGNHRLRLNALDIAPEQDCSRTALALSGNADPITYYSINGVATKLSRDLRLEYNTLKFSDETHSYELDPVTETLADASGTIHVSAPLCNTVFTLSGDRFLAAWGQTVKVESPEFQTIAIDAVTTAVQDTSQEFPNQQHVEAALGGSGPVDITFTAVVTDAVVYKEWQMAADPSFDVIDLRFPDLEVTRTFADTGTTYVRFVGGNNSGECDYTSETYQVYVGESQLLCPNAFSPNGDGTNDEWKVSYRSIVEFDCSIFNRWGQLMAHLTHPSQGWDGRSGGKLVPAGAYYYVITARGADGKKYNLSGDINIVKFTDNTTTR